MFCVGSVDPAQHQPTRRQQTAMFWDFESMHPNTPSITAANLYRKIKDHLKEKGVAASGVLRCTAYALATPTNQLALDLLEDLQIHVVRGMTTRAQLQQVMSADLAAIADRQNPTEVTAVVVISKEKVFVRDVKSLAENNFDVIVVHDAPTGSAEADILETYATRSYVLKDVLSGTEQRAQLLTAADSQHLAHMSTIPPAPAGSGGVIANKLLSGNVAGLTVLVEGRRISLEELERNEAVNYALAHPSPTGMRWCTPAIQALPHHCVQDCPYAHAALAAPPAAVALAGSATALPPPYIQAVQLLSKSPMMGPAVGAPPPPAGSSPIMAFHPAALAQHGHTHFNTHHSSSHPSPYVAPHHHHSQHMLKPGIYHHHNHHQNGLTALPPPSIPINGATVRHLQHAQQTTHVTAAVLPPPPPAADVLGMWGDVRPVTSNAAIAAAPAMNSIGNEATTSHVAQMEALLSNLAAPAVPAHLLGGHPSPTTQLDFFATLPSHPPMSKAPPPQRFGSGLLSDDSPSNTEDEDDVVLLQVPSPHVASSAAAAAAAMLLPTAKVSHAMRLAPAPVSATTRTESPVDVLRKHVDATASPTSAWGTRQDTGTVPLDPTEDLPTLESLGAVHRGKIDMPSAVRKPIAGDGSSTPATKSFASVVGATKIQASGKQPIAAKKVAVPQRPRELIIDGQTVSVESLVRNKFLESVFQSGTNTGRFCTDHRAHSMVDCTSAHRDKYALLQGGEVDGKVLLVNKALDNLRANTTYKGNFCTSPKPHDPLKCTYLHRKTGH